MTSRDTPAEALDPRDIRDIDMALRYSRIDHDYSCPAVSPMARGACTCGAADYRERGRMTIHRMGAPYRLPSGDYDLARLSRNEEAGEPRA